MNCTTRIQILSSAALATVVIPAAHAGWQYDAARSVTSITFQAAGAPASATFSNAVGPAWLAPNSAALAAVWEPTVGTHVGAPVTPNWDAYGTAMTHGVFGHLAANGIVNAIPVVQIPLSSYHQTTDPGNLIGAGTLRIDYTVEIEATPGGFNVGQLPAWMRLTYNIPAGSFGDFYADINYAAVNLAGVVVPIGAQVLDATPGAAILGGAGVLNLAAPGWGLNFGTVAFNPNPNLNGRLRVWGSVIWVVDNEGGPVMMELDAGGTDQLAPINDALESALQLTLDEPLDFATTVATTDGPVDSAGCSPGKDIWYVVRAPATGMMQVSLCDRTDFDSTMSFYYLGNSRTPPDLDVEAIFADRPFLCVDDTCGAFAGASEATVTGLVANDWLLVRVGGYDDGVEPASGEGTIRARFRQTFFDTGLHVDADRHEATDAR